MIKDLEIRHNFHSYALDKDGETIEKWLLSVEGEYNGERRQSYTAILSTDPVTPWIEVLYKQLVKDFEKEQPIPQESV